MQIVHVFERPVIGENGVPYRVSAFAEPEGNVWGAWLEFEPADGGAPLDTDRETTQPNLDAVAYWASGLEPVYLEGALGRARGRH
jgi:hypothetical protein